VESHRFVRNVEVIGSIAGALALLIVSSGCQAGGGNASKSAASQAPPPPVAKLAAPQYTADSWHVEGQAADACQCDVYCACEFMGLPSHGCCDDSAILHIDKGTFGGVNVDHSDVVIVSESPAGKRMVDEVGNLTFARIYVSKNVSDLQASALADVARKVLGNWVKEKGRISPNETVHKVDLTVSITPDKASAKIPSVLDLQLETLHGADEKAPIKIVNSPWAAPGIGDVSVGHSTKYDYTCDGRDWHYTGQSASFRPFKLEGKVKEEPAPGK
jgi:hypothetical protein